ncbi:flagellar hook-length control protein FliK [Rhodococcus sp. X156]|uniref:flagellar hook-length control protein FliK n=1 Tax=Rhodococcus sp. X156 TaxID=2499145 RepID=UPI000FDBF428|nr:flagellar hook-length control protein FliK [Rhodococcus sp. X156]
MAITLAGAPSTRSGAATPAAPTPDPTSGDAFAALLGAVPLGGPPPGTLTVAMSGGVPASTGHEALSVLGSLLAELGDQDATTTVDGGAALPALIPDAGLAGGAGLAGALTASAVLPLLLPLPALVPFVAQAPATAAAGTPVPATAVAVAPAQPDGHAPAAAPQHPASPAIAAPTTGVALPTGFTPVTEAESALLTAALLPAGSLLPTDPAVPVSPAQAGMVPAPDAALPAAGAPQVVAPLPAPVPTPPTTPVVSAPPAVPPEPVHHQVATALLGVHSRGEGSHQLELALHPAELGQVNVHVRMVDGALTVALASGSDATLDALRAALPELRQELRAAGLAQVTLSLDLTDPGTAHHQERAEQHASRPADRRPGPPAAAAAPEPDTPVLRSSTTALDRLL